MLFPDQALLHYPDLCQGPIQGQPLLGLNGGVCFRVQALIGDLCLKAWPAIQPQHLVQVHRLLQHSAAEGLEFLPRVHPTGDGITYWKDAVERLWDLTTWMPGQHASLSQITIGQIRSAAAALARLHLSWARLERPQTGHSPALRNRLKTWHDWKSYSSSGKTHALLNHWMPLMPRWLAPWQDRPLTLQWRHGDPWAGNLLFSGDLLTGLIDLGSVQRDTTLADLARLLGSLAQDDPALWQAGENAYGAVRTLTLEDRELLPVLDRSGVLGSLLHWIEWARKDMRPKKTPGQIKAAAQRISELNGRIRKWQ